MNDYIIIQPNSESIYSEKYNEVDLLYGLTNSYFESELHSPSFHFELLYKIVLSLTDHLINS
jgi:hypothetical protein